MFDCALVLGLAGSLVIWLPARIDGDELFSFYFLVLISILSFFFEKKREIRLVSLGCILVLALSTTLLHFRTPIRAQFMNIFVGALALKTISERTMINVSSLAPWLVGITLINDAFIWLQVFGKDALHQGVYPEVAGTFLIPWIMGCFGVLALPFIFSTCWAAALLLLPLVFYSHSYICALAFAIVLGYLLVKKHGSHLIPFAVMGIPAAFAYIACMDSHIDHTRFMVWKGSLQWLHNPWIGNGIGSWAHEAFRAKNGADWYHWRWAHNELFQQFFEQGLIGLLISSIWFVGLFRTKGFYLRAFLIGVFMLQAFHPIFHFGRLAVFLVIGFGLSVASAYEEEELCYGGQ